MLFSAMETQQIILIVLVVLLVLVLIVMPIFTNKKRQQSVNTLHNSLKVGDKIMTIGGVIGIVTDIRQTSPVDKEFTIETGSSTMVFDIKALYQIMPATAPVTAPVQQTVEAAETVKPETEAADVFEEPAEVKEEVKTEEPEVKAESAAEETAQSAPESKEEEVKPTSKKRTNSTKKPIQK